MSDGARGAGRGFRRRLAWLVLIASAVAACGEEAGAPAPPLDLPDGVTVRGDTIFVTGEPECGTCEILREPVTVLGDPSDPVSMALPTHGVLLTSGDIFLTHVLGAPGLVRYSESGRFREVVSVAGEGPGEFVQAHLLRRGPADSMFVIDLRQNRGTLLGPEGEFVAHLRWPIAPYQTTDLAMGRSGELLVAGPRQSGLEMGPPVHFLDREGQIIESVGTPMGPARADKPWRGQRSVALSPGGMIAIFPPNRYEIELLGVDGARRVMVRNVPWFVPWDEQERTGDPADLPPRLGSIWIDEADRMWVLVGVRAADLPLDAPWNAELATAPDVLSARRDQIVEVFDMKSGRLLASRRFSEVAHTVDGVGYHYWEDEDGIPRLDVLALTLRTD